MVKLIKLVFLITLLFFAFFSGVYYSDQTREMAGWLFETKGEEINLDQIEEDIQNNQGQESIIDGATIDQNGEITSDAAMSNGAEENVNVDTSSGTAE